MSAKSTRFNFVSETADGVGFAIKLAEQGEDVRVWIRDSNAKSVGDNLVPKVGDLEDLIHNASVDRDVFIFDVTGNGLIADYLRSQRFPVLGGSVLADRLERDRSFGAQVMESVRIQIPETISFSSFKDAREYVRKHTDSRFVYKPSKQLGDLSPSSVSYDAEDLLETLSNVEREVDIVDPQFELQEFVKGLALSTELWFEQGRLLPITNHTLERKELMNGDIGPSGGCTGNVVWLCDGCPVCDTTKRLVPWLEKFNYHGPIDLNVIVSETGIYGLEFTPRFGYDATPTLLWEVVNTGLGEFLANMARGQMQEVDLYDGFGAALRVTLPPWPSEKYLAEDNVPIRGLRPSDERHTYLYNVKLDDKGELCSAGAWGILMLITGRYGTINGALASPLEAAETLRVKNKQFRTDLAKVFTRDLSELEALIGKEVTV